MDLLNIRKRWIVQKIMTYLKKYLTSFSYENIQVEMLKGSCCFDELDFDVNVLEQEFKLPFNIISGRVYNLKIELPWYKFLSNADIKIETIDFEIKMKKPEKHQYDEKENSNEQNNLESAKDKSLSSKKLYIKELINTIFGNLSFSCNNVILKLVEDNIVFRVDIKLLTLNPCYDDWIQNNFTKKSSTQWMLKKMGKVVGITISMNKINKHGNTEFYFEPLVLNMSLSIRFCCVFETNYSVQPCLIQLDIFSPKIMINLMESHMLMMTEILNFFQKYNSVNNRENYDDKQGNIPTSSTSKPNPTQESWMSLINDLNSNSNNQISTLDQVLKIGIYIEELNLLLNFDMKKSPNEYKPLINTTCHGLNLTIVHSKLDTLNIQFGISKIMMNPEDDCICGFQDCFNNQKSFFSSGRIQEDYLRKSLFQKHTDFNNEKDFFLLYGSTYEKTSLKTTPSLAFNYTKYQKPTAKHTISLEAGACVINVTLGLLHRFQFILNFLSEHYSSLLITKPNSEKKQTDSFGESPTQNCCFNFKMSNILIKILPICHAPSSYKSKQWCSTVYNFPEALIEIYELRGSVKVDKSATFNNTEESKTRIFNLMADKLEAKVYKSNAMHSLLSINQIEWNKLESYCTDNRSDSSLYIGNVNFESSKDNYLLFYYIVHSIITTKQCDQMYTDGCFINSELLHSNLNFVVLYWEIEDVNIHCITQNQSFNFDITLKSVSSETIKLHEKNKFWSIIMTSLNELEDSFHPLLHIMLQIPSKNDVTQTPLLFVKTRETAINIDPLFFEWLAYVPEYKENPMDTDSLAGIDSRVENDLSFIFPVEDQLENKSKSFLWIERLKLMPIFVELSAVTFSFPSDVISISRISFIDQKIEIKRWLPILINHDIDVLIMSTSRLTVNCLLEKQQVDSYFDGFPIHFPESLRSNDQSLFPWEINVKELQCYIIYKKSIQSTVQDQSKVIDTIDIFCSFEMTGLTYYYNDEEYVHFESILNVYILKLITIHVSEKQVKIVGAVLKNITDALRVFSHPTECHNKADNKKFNTNAGDVHSKNYSEKSPLNDGTSEAIINENNVLDNVQYSVTIKFLINNITVLFYKNIEDNQFEPSLDICIFSPTMIFEVMEGSLSYQIDIHHTVMNIMSYKKGIKPDELHEMKNSIVFFESITDSVDIEENINFITIELSRSHKNDHPEIQINIEKDMCFSIHKVTINTLLEVMNMFNQKNKIENTVYKTNSADGNVNNSDSNANISKSNVLESSESNEDDILEISHLNWTACIKSKKLSLELFTETKDKLILNIENTNGRLSNCVRNVQTERNKQTIGEITINNAMIYLESFNSEDLLLHPTQIVINIRSPSPNPVLTQETSAKFNIDHVTLDISQNRCKTLLFIWKTFKYLFETNDNIAPTILTVLPTLQMSMSVLMAKIQFLQDFKRISSPRYHCVSEVLVKQKLLIIQLDEIQIGLHFHKENIIASAKSYVDFKIILHNHMTEISIVKLLINLTSNHDTNDKKRNNQFSIQTDNIQCQIGPSIFTSLTAAKDLWFSPSNNIAPYIICNDTCFTIIFKQANTDENIILNGLDSYNYSWLISTEEPGLQFAIKNKYYIMSNWSKKVTIKSQNQKYLNIIDSDGKATNLILSMQQTSPVSIKIVITSTLKLMNKTEHFLVAQIIPDTRVNDLGHTLIVGPYEVTPSLMFEPDNPFSVALRYSTLNSHWSDTVNVHNINETKENTKCVLVNIPNIVNRQTKFNCVVCHFVFETIDGIPQLLILLLPPSVIRSYLPNDTSLNVNVRRPYRRKTDHSVKVKSAIEQDNVQKIDLPIFTSDNDDDVHILLSLSEDKYTSWPVSVSPLEKQSDINMMSGIQEHENNPYALERTSGLKWPFVGDRFDRVQWKSGVARHKIATTQTIQNYGVFGDLGTYTRLITIWPWALVVNTTGESISLRHSSTRNRCTLADKSVVVPARAADNDDRTFHVEINAEDDDRYCSSAINFFDGQHSPKLYDGDSSTTSTDKQTIVFANGPHSIAYLIATSSVFKFTRIAHLQSLYVATNCSSTDLDVLLVCSMPSTGLLDVPAHSDGLFAALPRTSTSLGRPLSLWTLVGSTTVRTSELDQYLVIAWRGNSSCPIALRNVKISEKDEHSVPVVFSSFASDVRPEPPSICMTLKKHDDQYVIGICEQPYPQLVFHNLSATTLTVTDGPELAEEPTIRLIASDWYWPYELMPGGTLRLTFPYRTFVNGVTLSLIVTDGSPRSECLASVAVNNSECTATYAPGYDREMDITVSRRAFTWHVVISTKVLNNSSIRTLTEDHRRILDVERSLSMMEVFIEDKYFDQLLKYFQTYDVISFKYDVMNDVLEGFIPINTSPLPAIYTFRTLRITPFQLMLNHQCSKQFDISANHLRIKFDEFKRTNMQASLPQLGQCASIHYYGGVINNTGNAMSSLGLQGSQRNCICMAKRGFHDLITMSTEGFVRGPKSFVFGVAGGLKSLSKHISLGLLLSVMKFSKSWARTINNFQSLKYISAPFVNVLKNIERASSFCIQKLL